MWSNCHFKYETSNCAFPVLSHPSYFYWHSQRLTLKWAATKFSLTTLSEVSIWCSRFACRLEVFSASGHCGYRACVEYVMQIKWFGPDSRGLIVIRFFHNFCSFPAFHTRVRFSHLESCVCICLQQHLQQCGLSVRNEINGCRTVSGLILSSHLAIKA